jgi:hypothetical protein
MFASLLTFFSSKKV